MGPLHLACDPWLIDAACTDTPSDGSSAGSFDWRKTRRLGFKLARLHGVLSSHVRDMQTDRAVTSAVVARRRGAVVASMNEAASMAGVGGQVGAPSRGRVRRCCAARRQGRCYRRRRRRRRRLMRCVQSPRR